MLLKAKALHRGVDSRSNIGSIGTESLSFNVGDTHVFSLYSSYCPLPNSNVEFEVLAKGEHCYIWTPTSTAANVYPLDEIDESFAQICADEFDSKFALMQSSFGDHANGSQGDGRLNILYYNIDDGWTPAETIIRAAEWHCCFQCLTISALSANEPALNGSARRKAQNLPQR